MPRPKLNVSEYSAYRRGCGLRGSRPAIQSALRKGWIEKDADGLIDVADADARWAARATPRSDMGGYQLGYHALRERYDQQTTDGEPELYPLGAVVDRTVAEHRLVVLASRLAQVLPGADEEAVTGLVQVELRQAFCDVRAEVAEVAALFFDDTDDSMQPTAEERHRGMDGRWFFLPDGSDGAELTDDAVYARLVREIKRSNRSARVILGDWMGE